MADYITNAQISVPLYTGLKPDVDLGGLQFSYQHGIFYDTTASFLPITLPPPWPGTTPTPGGGL